MILNLNDGNVQSRVFEDASEILQFFEKIRFQVRNDQRWLKRIAILYEFSG